MISEQVNLFGDIEDQAMLRKEYQRNIRLLLDQVGDVSRCKGCGKQIWWVTTRAGKAAPYTEDAANHFSDCPQAARYRKKD